MTALKRLESERGLGVQEGTIDQVRRALEAAGILFIESGQGRGVMFLHETSDPQARQNAGRRGRSPS
ncbi:XRE family transcriptional regulator [Komagataeibacter europaeus]